MHWTTHVIAGAAIGYSIERPLPAAVAGVLSHVALDAAPHYDAEYDISHLIDSALGASVLVALARAKRARGGRWRGALWGALGAGAPDLELTLKLVKEMHDEDYYFPSHNTTLPHPEAGIAVSLALEAVALGAALGGAALMHRRARLRGASAGDAPGG